MTRPTRILTVDDSASMRALLLHALTSRGFEVEQAIDGQAALEWLATMLQQVAASSQRVSSGSAEIRAASDDLALRNEKQAASLEETAAAMNQVTDLVKRSADNAGEARESIEVSRSRGQRIARSGQQHALFVVRALQHGNGAGYAGGHGLGPTTLWRGQR